MLLGNKLDKLEFGGLKKEDITAFSKSLRQVAYEEGRRYASDNGILFGEVSALTG